MADSTSKCRHVYRSDELDDWLVNHHRANLVHLVSNTTKYSFPPRGFLSKDQGMKLSGRTGYRVDFAELQRMKMRKLQIKLIRHAATMAKAGKEPETSRRKSDGKEPAGSSHTGSDDESSTTWEDDLETYVKAVRDYDYMLEVAGKVHDPFVASSEHRVDHKILEEEMHKAGIDFSFLANNIQVEVDGASEKVLILPTGPWSADNSPIWGERYLKPIERYRNRFRALFVAYMFVLFPGMLIVATSLVPGTVGTVIPFIIIACFVAVWAVGMIFSVTQIKDVVALTAGYTAVLGIILNGATGLRKSTVEATAEV